MSAPGWPARLVDPDRATGLVLRPLRQRDARAWAELRRRNQAWLGPWDATPPPVAVTQGTLDAPMTLRQGIRGLRRLAAKGQSLPFVIEVDGVFAGQVTASTIVRGSSQSTMIGYWLDELYAGRGLMPRSVALLIDHCLTTAGLHRVEIAIRPENANSLRVVEKLGLAEYGYAPRYLHINGDWRDHRLFAITTEELGPGVRSRL